MNTPTLSEFAEKVTEPVSHVVATGVERAQDLAHTAATQVPELKESVVRSMSRLADHIRPTPPPPPSRKPWLVMAIVLAAVGVWWWRRTRWETAREPEVRPPVEFTGAGSVRSPAIA